MQTIKKVNTAPLLPCPRLWSIHIEPTGDVNLCGCRTNYTYEENPLKVGNLNDSSLKQILKSKKIFKIRESFLKGGINDICRNCTWYGN